MRGYKTRSTRSGVTSFEYALVVTFIAAFCFGGIRYAGQAVAQELDKAGNYLQLTAGTADDQILAPQVDSPVSPRATTGTAWPIAAVVCLFGGAALAFLVRRRPLGKQRKTASDQVALESEALNKVLRKRNAMRMRLLDSGAELFDGRGTVGMCMTTDVRTVEQSMSIELAEAHLKQLGYRRVMVVDADGNMAGVLSRKDISAKVGKLVRDVMTSNPRVATPETTLKSALTMVLENRISCLPVVQEGKLVGLVSTSDLLLVFQCLLVLLSERHVANPQQYAEIDAQAAELRLSDLPNPSDVSLWEEADPMPAPVTWQPEKRGAE